ncbi:MAG: D-3-phosphoglycerate dehydrogenase, partial [Tetragenococcus halophilus]|nr:D-3-phosphoglycerate dehydrogenase [Tetragenococcus halophilus]
QISAVIADFEINIDNMINRGRDDYAYTLVDIDESDENKIANVVEKLRETDDIIRVRVIKKEEVPY